MKRLSRSSRKYFPLLALILGVIVTPIQAFCAPQIHLPDGGAYFWSSSGTIVHGCFPLNDGARVMVVFYENRASDGVPHLFYQIIGEDLEPEFDPPRQFSDENSAPYPGNAILDENGNIIIAWLAREVDLDGQVRLFAQKFSPEGEPLWEGDPHLVGTIAAAQSDGTIPNLMSDDHGGFYYTNFVRFLAVDSTGAFRDNWPWAERRPDPEWGMAYYAGYGPPAMIRGDGAGGIWYECLDDLDRIWNHLNYEGEKRWEELRRFAGRGLPEVSEGADFKGTMNGGALFYDYLAGRRYLFNARLNSDSISVADAATMAVFPNREFIKRRNGDFIASWQIDRDEGRRRGILIYNPVNRSFPWGTEGYELGWSPFSESSFTGGFAELNNNDIIACSGFESYSHLFRFNSAGNLIWGGRRIESIFPKTFIPTEDNGFWALGTSTMWHGGGEVNLLNRYDSNGRPQGEDFIDIGTRERFDPRIGQLWIDENGQYRYLFCQPWLGYKMVTLTPVGEIVGDPDGRAVLANRGQGKYPRFSIRAGGLNIFFDTYLHATALNDEGELVWEQNYNIPEWTGSTGEVRWFLSPDSQSIFVMRATTNYADMREEVGFASRFNVADGELQWRFLTPRFAPPMERGGFAFALSRDAVYHVLDWTSDSGAVYSTGYDGEPLTERPFIFYRELENTRIFGTAPAPDGGFWIGFVERSEEGLDCYLQKFDREEGFTQRIYPYAEPSRGEYVWEDENLPYQLIASNECNWIIPNQSIGMGVQCVTQDGERLIGEYGWNREAPILRGENDYLKCLPDGEGGLWVALRSTESGVRAFHFDPDSGLSNGWSPEGELIAGGEQRPSIEEIFALPGRNLLIACAGAAAVVGNPLVTRTGNYYLQHISEELPDEAESEDHNSPVTFEIVSLYPQPFNSRLNIVYQSPRNATISVRVYDLTGRLIESQKRLSHKEGRQSISLDASNWQSGVYFLQIDDGAISFSRKTVLLK